MRLLGKLLASHGKCQAAGVRLTGSWELSLSRAVNLRQDQNPGQVPGHTKDISTRDEILDATLSDEF